VRIVARSQHHKINSDSRVRIARIIHRAELAHEQQQELHFRDLIPERIQKTQNRIDLQYRVHASRLRPQVLEDVFREEPHDVDERVRNCYSVLHPLNPT